MLDTVSGLSDGRLKHDTGGDDGAAISPIFLHVRQLRRIDS